MQKLKNHLIAVLILSLVISGALARPLANIATIKADTWYNNNWSYRKKVTIQSSQIDTTLSDFPTYIDLADMGSDFFSRVKSDGTDIVVTSSDEVTKVDREVVDIDTGAEAGELWFKAPSLSSSVDTEFYIYYGNPSASEANAEGVWSEFRMVHHFEENPADVDFIDSSGFNSDGFVSSMESEDSVAGQIGQAFSFDGVDEFITLSTVLSNFEGLNSGTISFWVNTTSTSTCPLSITQSSTGNNMLLFCIGSFTGSFPDESLSFYLIRGGTVRLYYNVREGTPTYLDGNWHYVTMSHNSSSKTVTIDGDTKTLNYVNGGAATNELSNIDSPNVARIASQFRSITNAYYDGDIDEIRISTEARSADWSVAEYRNQSSPNTFYSIATQEFTDAAGLALTGLTGNEWDGISQTEVCAVYPTSTEFESGDTINLTFSPAFNSAVLDATPAEDDADDDTTVDGSFTALTSSSATYTFTDSTTQAVTNGVTVCLDLPASQTQQSHSITMSDSNGNFGGTLLHVADNNDVNVYLEVIPSLSFNIRNLDDSADINTCDLGTIDTTTTPNTDTTDDGDGECGYSLAVGTNAESGFQVQVTSDGALRNATSSIINAAEGENISAGNEAYGLINITAAQTGRNGGTGDYDQTITEDGDFNDDDDYTPIPTTPTNFVSYTDGIQYIAGTDAIDVTRIMHGMTVGAGTPAGYYQQVVTYTATVTF